MRIHDSEAYRKIDVTRERIIRILELREILLSFQTGLSSVDSAIVVYISGLEPSSVITEPISSQSKPRFALGLPVLLEAGCR